MARTKALRDLGQSLWLDNITRELLQSGTLARYIQELGVTGLTSNPTIFARAVTHSAAYDGDIERLRRQGLSGEALFFELAVADITHAADLFAPTFERSAHVDGWVSLEVSPLLANDTAGTLAAAKALYARAARPNLYIKVPGTKAGLTAIEELIFSGVPVNITLLFSPSQYLSAADAVMKGLERRQAQGLSLDVSSVASVFVSRFDKAVSGQVPVQLENHLGIAVARKAYAAYRELLASERFLRLANSGARPQRLLFASTGTKDPRASDVLYVSALAAPATIDTLPEETLLAFADHGEVFQTIPADAGDAGQVLAAFEKAGVSVEGLATRLQEEGAQAFARSWQEIMSAIALKSRAVA